MSTILTRLDATTKTHATNAGHRATYAKARTMLKNSESQSVVKCSCANYCEPGLYLQSVSLPRPQLQRFHSQIVKYTPISAYCSYLWYIKSWEKFQAKNPDYPLLNVFYEDLKKVGLKNVLSIYTQPKIKSTHRTFLSRYLEFA